MSTSIKISHSAFDGSIPTAITNEIPHVPTYSILNQHLRNTWSHELIGKTFANYDGTRNSIKMVNGEQSENYFARYLKFVEPDENKIYEVDVGKIDFSVDGAWEMEMDYLMHEMSRYLSKLYPDDFLSLVTLTEAERQSYFNEALHMIHSYFDTEQISTDDLLEDLYYRNRFATGITAIRKHTGVAKQEEQLVGLLSTIKETLNVYSGYRNYVNSEGKTVTTYKDSTKLEDVSLVTNFYTNDSDTVLSCFAEKITGKTSPDSLKNFYENATEILAINETLLKSNFKAFYKIELLEPEELLNYFISDDNSIVTVNLNKLILQATEQGEMRAGSSFVALKKGSFKDLNVVVANTTAYSFIFDSFEKLGIQVLNGDTGKFEDLQDFENSYVINESRISNLDTSFLIKLGSVEFSEKFLLIIGNWIASQISYLYQSSEDFSKNLQAVYSTSSSNLQLKVEVLENDTRIFAGLINKDYYSKLESVVVGNHFSLENCKEDFSALNICSYIIGINLVKEKLLKASDTFDFVFSVIYTNDFEYLSKNAIVGKDTINYELPVTLAIAKNETGYDVELRKVERLKSQTTVSSDTQETYIDVYTGSTKLGKVVKNATSLECVLVDENTSTFRINGFLYRVTDDYKLLALNTAESDVEIGKRVSYNKNNVLYFEPEIYDFVKSDRLERLDGILLNSAYTNSVRRSFNDILFTETTNTLPLKYLEIEWYDSLQNIIQNNFTSSVENAISSTKSILYVTKLIRNVQFKVASDIVLSQTTLGKVLFQQKKFQSNYELFTAKCEFYADNVVRITKDVVDDVNRLARVNSIVLDSYGNTYSANVIKASIKSDYCYLTLDTTIQNISSRKNISGYIILDYCRSLDSSETEEQQAEMSKRELESKKLYRANNQYFFLETAWESLNRENLNYWTDNIYSKESDISYGNNSYINKYTKVPTSLVELENLTFIDTMNNSSTVGLIKDIIAENKSLYLDSSVKFIVNAPLSLHNLVHDTTYGIYTYLYSDTPPSYIDLYSSSNYKSYQPFSDFLNATKEELSLVDIENIYNRRFVIWGSVVWDANNVNKTIATLRTIWGGYFTNFEIFSSEDFLPSEQDLLSLENNSSPNKKSVDILNFNYSSNAGTPESLWNICVGLPKSQQGSSQIQVIDAFSHNTVYETENTPVTAMDYTSAKEHLTFVDSFSILANRLDLNKNSLQLMHCTSDLEAIDVSGVKLQSQIINDVSASYLPDSQAYSFKLTTDASKRGNYSVGSNYKLRLVYNMLHDKSEDFEPIGLFKFANLHSSTALLLEYFVYQYIISQIVGYNTKETLPDELTIDTVLASSGIEFSSNEDVFISSLYTDTRVDEIEAWKAYNKKQNQSRNIIKLSAILDYMCNCTDYIPTVAAINSSGNIELYYARAVKLADNEYVLYTGSLVEQPSGDLLDCLLPVRYSSFQIKPSIYSKNLGLLTKYQYALPTNLTGTFNNLDIVIDADQYKTLEESNSLANRLLGKSIENTQKEDGLLTNIFEDQKGLVVDANSLDFSNFTTVFDLLSSSVAFREAYPVNIELSTTDATTNSADILRCQMHFDKDFKLTNDGYLYLTDLSIPNIRSSYNEKRETQIVERDYLLENLHILAFQEDGNYAKFILQDSKMSQSRKITGIIDKIKPVDDTKDSQLIVDTELNFGFTWVDPGVRIGYTFYKRKFVAEGVIDGVLPTTVRLADDSLNEDDNFDLTNHIAPGDSVQLWILNPTSNYVDGGVAKISLSKSGWEDADDYIGPYKVIYVSKNSSKASPTQDIILSGPGNLVNVAVEISTGKIDISKPFTFDSTNTYYAFATANGEIVYRDDTGNAYTVVLKDGTQIVTENFKDFVNDADKNKPDNFETIETLVTASTVNPVLSEALLNTLTSEHKDWTIFDKTGVTTEEEYEGEDAEDLVGKDIDAFADDEDKLHGESDEIVKGAPAELAETIALPNGKIAFDTYDRSFFLPDDEEEAAGDTIWLSNPAQAEDFDVSGSYEAIVSNDVKVSIDDADEYLLRDFIKNSIISIFDQTSIAALIGSGQVSEPGEITENSDPDYKQESETLPSNADKRFSFAPDTHIETAQVAIGKTLFNVNGTGEIFLNNATIFLPKFTEMDVPVYLKEGQEPKWKKANVITGTTGRSIDQASLEELRIFAHAINPTDYVTRRSTKITSWIKTNKNIVAWDQTTGTLTIMDKVGNLKSRVAIPTIGYRQPVTTDALKNKESGLNTAWTVNNRIYAATANSKAMFAEYVTQANKRYQVLIDLPSISTAEKTENKNNEYSEGIYEVFDQGGTLYLPTLFNDFKNKSDADIKDTLKKGNADYFDKSGMDCSTILDKALELIHFALDTTNYKAYREYCKWVDYLAPDSCEFVSLKDKSHICNTDMLEPVLVALKSVNATAYNTALTALSSAQARLTQADANVSVKAESLRLAKKRLTEAKADFESKKATRTVAYNSWQTAKRDLSTAESNLETSKSNYKALYTDFDIVRAVDEAKTTNEKESALQKLYGKKYVDSYKTSNFISTLCTKYDEDLSKYSATYTEAEGYIPAYISSYIDTNKHSFVTKDIDYREASIELRKAEEDKSKLENDLVTAKADEARIKAEYEEALASTYFEGRLKFLYGEKQTDGTYKNDSIYKDLSAVKSTYAKAISAIQTWMGGATAENKLFYRNSVVSTCLEIEGEETLKGKGKDTDKYTDFKTKLREEMFEKTKSAETAIYSIAKQIYDSNSNSQNRQIDNSIYNALQTLINVTKSTSTRGTVTSEKTTAMDSLIAANDNATKKISDTTLLSLKSYIDTFKAYDFSKFESLESESQSKSCNVETTYMSEEILTDGENVGQKKGTYARALAKVSYTESEIDDVLNGDGVEPHRKGINTILKPNKNAASDAYLAVYAQERAAYTDVMNKIRAVEAATANLEKYKAMMTNHPNGTYELITNVEKASGSDSSQTYKVTTERKLKVYTNETYVAGVDNFVECTAGNVLPSKAEEYGGFIELRNTYEFKESDLKNNLYSVEEEIYKQVSSQTYPDFENASCYYYEVEDTKEKIENITWSNANQKYTVKTVNGSYTSDELPILYELVPIAYNKEAVSSLNNVASRYYIRFEKDEETVQEKYSAALEEYLSAQRDVLADDKDSEHDTAQEAYNRSLTTQTAAVRELNIAKENIKTLERVSNSDKILEAVLKQVSDTLVPQIVKGLPYFTEETLDNDNILNKYKDSTALRLTSISTTGSTTYAFESLISTSGIEIVNGVATIYGEIDWPVLTGDNGLRTRIKNRVSTAMKESVRVDETYKNVVADYFADTAVQEVRANFAAFYGTIDDTVDESTGNAINPYVAGLRPFTVNVDLETLQVVNVVNKPNGSGDLPSLLTVKANGETVTALSDKGEISMTPGSVVLQDAENTSKDYVTAKGIVQVYDALKDLDVFGPLTIDADTAEMSIQLVGTNIANPDIAYSTVKSVSGKTFELRDDVVLLNTEERVNAILLVKSTQKDNFQFSYGSVTNIEYIPAAKTIFEVPNYHYADFATYDNKASVGGWKTGTTEDSEAQVWAKPSVFDLYPEFEEIDDQYRKYFYKESAAEKAQYLKNDNGRYIFRISSTYGEYVGGQLVRANTATVAGSDESAISVVKDSGSYDRSYDYVLKNLNLQKVPALIDNPNAAIQDYPYKLLQLDAESDSKTRLQVYDDFLVATVKVTGVAEKIKDAYTDTAKSRYLNANKLQLIAALETAKDFEELSDSQLKSISSTAQFFDSLGNLRSDSYIESRGVKTTESVSDNTVTVKPYNCTTITNTSYTADAVTNYTGSLKGNWTVLRDNLTISKIKTSIDNRTKTLPRFVPITKYKSKRNKDNELVLLGTASKELYIPAKGYGQALIGNYTTPAKCLFKEGVFYDKNSDHYTRNESGEIFKLVDQYGQPFNNEKISVPNLIYKSFASADAELSKKLPTQKTLSETIGIDKQTILIDMSNFSDVDAQNIYIENSKSLLDLNLITGILNSSDDSDTVKQDFIYELFKNNLEIHCMLSYSKLPIDESAANVVRIDDEELKSKLGYTRAFADNITLPVGYKYKLRDSTYKRVLTGPARDLDHVAADSKGNILYVDLDGNITNTVTRNPPVPCSRTPESLIMFSLQSNRIQSILYDCFYTTLKTIKGNYQTNTIGVTESAYQKSFICKVNPNTAYSSYSKIKKRDASDQLDWLDYLSFKWHFHLVPDIENKTFNLELTLKYKEETKTYNFAYLKDLNGNVVGKVYFETPISEDTQLVFSNLG